MHRAYTSVALRWAACALAGIAIVAGCARQNASTTTSTTAQTAAGSPLPSATLPPNPWVVPTDVANATASPGPTVADYDDLGWQSFVALNWPAAVGSTSGVSGLPNTKLPIGAHSANKAMVPTVWLTYRADSNTMLAKAQDPGPWPNNPVKLPSSCAPLSASTPVTPGFQPMYLDLITKFGTGNVLEASGPPLIDQAGWYVTYDIRLDMSEYTYIQKNGYFNAQTQTKAVQNNTFVGFPRTGREAMFSPPLPPLAQFGALEVKAAWRVLDPVKDRAVIPRYYTQAGYFLQPDGKTCAGPTLFGLIGMHILRLTPSTPATWFWASFEQVDNVDPVSPSRPPTLAKPNTPNGNCTPSYNVAPTSPPGDVPWNNGNTPVNVCRVTPLPDDVVQSNQSWQAKLAGTVWANYEMIGTIEPAPAGASPYPIPSPPTNTTPVNTDTLANTAMETYFQIIPGTNTRSSCMTCHAAAAPQGVNEPPPTTTYQIFTFVLGDAVTPAPSTAPLAASAPKAKPARRQAPLPSRVQALLRAAETHASAVPSPAASGATPAPATPATVPAASASP
ncbi:MAG TPA: hypothetical protein VFB22_05545 [Candidatus Baltobacteraceae bacterium]|nr:hypothetical protein [Candidatus Baltobacteraceae bacterium]